MSYPSTSRHRSRRLAATLILASAPAWFTLAPAHADSPGVGTATVVTVGDSYLDGEAGRWAGNTNKSSATVDALGSTAYFDNATHTAELINRCHRSAAAPAYLGGGINGVNLGCSGAQTTSLTDSSGYFKPGLDFYDNGSGLQGQATMLRNVAKTANVKAVVVTIGGNEFNFASVISTCVSNFLSSSSLLPNYCYDDSSVSSNFSATNVAAAKAKTVTALQNIRTAMRDAGYADGTWTLIVMGYPQPVPKSTDFRYSQTGYTRQQTGGCGLWNKDADWANNTAVPAINANLTSAVAAAGISPVVTVDMTASLNGHRLCDKAAGLLEEKGLASWTDPSAVDKSEWVNQIRTVSTATSDYYIQESLHPNYWGQLAQRSCLRLAYNNGAPTSGACTIAGTGLLNGEPRMKLG